MIYVSDENMQFLVDMIGEIYEEWLSIFDEDINNRNSYSFFIRRISDYLENKNIIYSVNGENSLLTSIKDDTKNIITISSGEVIDINNNNIEIKEHDLLVSRCFPYNYPANGHYGILIGFYHNDINSINEIRQSKLKLAIEGGISNYVYVESNNIFTNITFPIIANINNEDIVISSYESIIINGTTYYRGLISQNYNNGVAINSHEISSKIFIYRKLEASMIFGPPVSEEHQSGDAANFKYFPNKPDDFLEICRVVAANPIIISEEGMIPPDTTEIIGIVDTRDLGESSTEVPFTDNEKKFAKSVIDNLNKVSNIVNFENALSTIVLSLNNIVFSDSSGKVSGIFPTYWNNRPLNKSSFHIYGVQWDSIERFEVPDSFRKLWYKYLSNELLTTFAIFNGELMDNVTKSGITPPKISNISYTNVEYNVGVITPGDWTYAVTAITDSGESALSEYKTIRIPTSSLYNTITITWEPVTGAIGYNVYKKDSRFNLLHDIRLTEYGTLTETIFTDNGSFIGKTTKRGVLLTNKTSVSTSGTEMYAYIPIINNDELYSLYGFYNLGEDIMTDLTKTNNGVKLILELYKPNNSIEIVELEVNKGTPVGTAIKIGNNLYTGIKDMKIELIDGQIEKIGNTINWSITDKIYIQNINP